MLSGGSMAADFYPWIKSLHVIAVVAWMAGLFYLPRLFVYHRDAALQSETSELFKMMEGRLLRIIMRPAAVITLVTGTLLIAVGNLPLETWLEIKLAAVLAMSLFNGFLEKCAGLLRRDERPYSSKFFRGINEVPTILLAVIVIMVIVKPFQ
jgi:protoporphyrinogen IX oxidase